MTDCPVSCKRLHEGTKLNQLSPASLVECGECKRLHQRVKPFWYIPRNPGGNLCKSSVAAVYDRRDEYQNPMNRNVFPSLKNSETTFAEIFGAF
jgi:hypothetical protein